MMLNQSLSDLLILVPLFIISISMHEAAHAYAAYYFGDNTAKDLGRLTLNPLAHLDPFGALLVVFIGFGWAKPVPVNPNNLRNREWQMPVIAAAGPLSNFFLAAISLFILLLVAKSPSLQFLILPLRSLINLNLLLMLFNLVPLPPLDGSAILRWFLPSPLQLKMDAVGTYGSLILMGLVFLPGVSEVFFSVIYAGMNYVLQFLMLIFGFLL